MFQVASVVGPSIGGLLIAAAGVGWVYVVNALSFGCVILALLMMRGVSGRPEREADAPADEVSLKAAMEGLRFVFASPLIRSTMLLDFFATFFSSATALLPIFAQDVLRVGATGYGWLYAAPALGAVLMSAVMIPLTSRIVRRGPVLLWAVAAYGAATAVFGVSRWFWLTFLCLAMTGAMDTISMIIRNIVRQLETPDRLRGRMIGVNMVFFQGGPQLGELEAGAVASWLGPVVSVVTGGLGCVIATAWVAVVTPALRRVSIDVPAEAGRYGRRGVNVIVISGSSVILSPGTLLSDSLTSSAVFGACSLAARFGIGRDLVDVDVDERDAVAVDKRARGLNQRALRFEGDAETRAGRAAP